MQGALLDLGPAIALPVTSFVASRLNVVVFAGNSTPGLVQPGETGRVCWRGNRSPLLPDCCLCMDKSEILAGKKLSGTSSRTQPEEALVLRMSDTIRLQHLVSIQCVHRQPLFTHTYRDPRLRRKSR